MEPIKQKLLDFLKAMLEGNSSIRFKVWFHQNQKELNLILSKPQLLRLKFNPIEFAEKYLLENELSYVRNENAIKLEIYLTSFSSDFLDADGYLKMSRLEKVYDGIVGKYLSGKTGSVEASINKILKRNNGNNSFLTNETLDLLYFAETLAYQDKNMSKFFLNAIKDYFLGAGFEFSEIEYALKRCEEKKLSRPS